VLERVEGTFTTIIKHVYLKRGHPSQTQTSGASVGTPVVIFFLRYECIILAPRRVSGKDEWNKVGI